MASRENASPLAKAIFPANQWQVEMHRYWLKQFFWLTNGKSRNTFLFATTILLLCGSLIGSVEEVWGRGGREGGGGEGEGGGRGN